MSLPAFNQVLDTTVCSGRWIGRRCRLAARAASPARSRLAVDVVIRRRQVLVGYAPEWTRRRVELLLTDVLIPRATLREP
jgi:hypothetical protein